MYNKNITILGTNKGYYYFIDDEHPLATGNSHRVYLHRHVVSMEIGRWITSDEHVHHIDENKLNNDPNNLLIVTKEEHARIHMLEKLGIDINTYEKFEPYESSCKQCNNSFIVNDKRQKGFCSVSCANTYRHENKIPFEPPTNESETYKDVVGYENDFCISDNGNLFSKRTGKILKQTLSNGYYSHTTKIKVNNIQKNICFKIGKIMAIAFLPNPENKPCIIYKDGNKSNNDLENIEWATYQECHQNKKKNNKYNHATGETVSTSKLTDDIVRYCRKVFIPKHPEFGIDALSNKFGIHKTNLRKAINGKSWKHVK